MVYLVGFVLAALMVAVVVQARAIRDLRVRCQQHEDRASMYWKSWQNQRELTVRASHDARVIAMMAPKQLKQIAQFCEAVSRYSRGASL